MVNAQAARRRACKVRKAQGEPKLPSNQIVLCSSCAAGLLLLVARSGVGRGCPKSGLKNKRITLDADRAAPCGQPVSDAASGQFYGSRAGRSAGNSSPKRSVCYASILLFLLLWNRQILFLFCCFDVVVLVVPLTKHMPCQQNKIL